MRWIIAALFAFTVTGATSAIAENTSDKKYRTQKEINEYWKNYYAERDARIKEEARKEIERRLDWRNWNDPIKRRNAQLREAYEKIRKEREEYARNNPAPSATIQYFNFDPTTVIQDVPVAKFIVKAFYFGEKNMVTEDRKMVHRVVRSIQLAPDVTPVELSSRQKRVFAARVRIVTGAWKTLLSYRHHETGAHLVNNKELGQLDRALQKGDLFMGDQMSEIQLSGLASAVMAVKHDRTEAIARKKRLEDGRRRAQAKRAARKAAYEKKRRIREAEQKKQMEEMLKAYKSNPQ